MDVDEAPAAPKRKAAPAAASPAKKPKKAAATEPATENTVPHWQTVTLPASVEKALKEEDYFDPPLPRLIVISFFQFLCDASKLPSFDGKVFISGVTPAFLPIFQTVFGVNDKIAQALMVLTIVFTVTHPQAFKKGSNAHRLNDCLLEAMGDGQMKTMFYDRLPKIELDLCKKSRLPQFLAAMMREVNT